MRHPRVSGAVPYTHTTLTLNNQSSPRERGCSQHEMSNIPKTRVIPA